jgi:glycosyltransferase involved in cell wall biosynthesis
MINRILHVSQPVDAGVAVVLADLAEFQHASGWEVHVACPPDGWLARRLTSEGITVHPWKATRAPNPASFGEARELMAVVRRLRPDVVHLHSSKAGLAGRLAIRGQVATVFQPHSWSFHAVGGLVASLSAGWERIAMRWTDLVVAVSGEELDEGYRRGIEPRRTVVAPNGVDVLRFAPQDQASARARLGLGSGPLAVCVGRLARQKGQDLLLEAWPRVLATVPDARLALVGDGPERDRLADLVRRTPSSTLHGATGGPEDWYAAADVVVMPSRWEGMALVPLEAMACERSVVGFGVAGLAESIGDAGVVVGAGDLTGLALEVSRRLADRDQAAREGRLGRARAVSLYDRHNAVAVTDEAIRSLLTMKQRPGRPPAPRRPVD